ncbi:MAG: single-stranded-DNA-specific exonuclease RecJ [Verrucomicrobia bacterium]|nr:single-stranded-DNA-specific exonuclease RecJ [Verrucomicrobiota bacterium]
MKYRWITAPAQPALANFLAKEVGVSPLLAQCLLNRGLSEPDSIRRFLEPRLKSLADPFLIPGLSAATERLLVAREKKERVVVFGDYDVDGVTSAALLCDVFSKLGISTQCYLPHRLDEGYGLTQSGVENCRKRHPTDLIVAVDCGSTSVDVIARLKDAGIDVIVVDHHQVSSPAPAAFALVNPQVQKDPPWFKELCSAGLAFKLAHGLVKRARDAGINEAMALDIRNYLDLVALGTIADLVPLTGENRILVSAGLERLDRTERPGLTALKEVARIQGKIRGYEVGFQLAPRLNAAGRLEAATQALELLQAPDAETAMPLAQRLDNCNAERQAIERAITEQALAELRSRFDPAKDYVLIAGGLSWHIGVVGIVASRICQEFHRPTIVFGGDGHEWRGSGRSIDGFDLAGALRQCSDLLLRHGGHAMAAGVSINPSKLGEFKERINHIARTQIPAEQLQPRLRLDAEVTTSDLSMGRIAELQRLQQTGMGNPQVQVFARGLTHHRPLQRIGAERKHAKLWIKLEGRTSPLEAVWWGVGDAQLPTGCFDLAFAPKLNEYQGNTSVQLSVLDWRPAEAPAI